MKICHTLDHIDLILGESYSVKLYLRIIDVTFQFDVCRIDPWIYVIEDNEVVWSHLHLKIASLILSLRVSLLELLVSLQILSHRYKVSVTILDIFRLSSHFDSAIREVLKFCLISQS